MIPDLHTEKRPRFFADLRGYLGYLERNRELVRVRAEVDPVLEVSEITQRVVRQGGPALLFERVRGADFALVTNLFGSMRRIEMALGRHPREIGEELLGLLDRLNPPSARALWSARGPLARMRHARLSIRSKAPVQSVVEAPALDRMPHLTAWPRDGGPFVTWGPTLTCDPATGRRNFGLYRLQVFGPAETGMHWQSMKGGRGHYFEAERRGVPLEAAVILGGDPILMMSAIFPLPEGFDELAVAGWIRGAPTPMVRARSIGLLVPSNAEFVLEGHVPPGERRMEGPFGDHFGHYSEASPFPVFHVKTVTRRRDAIYPGTVVGKPPQEDKFLGIAAGELIGPLVRLLNPNITGLYAYDAACFHNLLGVALRERHPKEVLKTAFNLLGTGQLALTKVLVLVREDVDPRSFCGPPLGALVAIRAGRTDAPPPGRAARHARLHVLHDARREQGDLRRHGRARHVRSRRRARSKTRRHSIPGFPDGRSSQAGFVVVKVLARGAGGAVPPDAVGRPRPRAFRRGRERGRRPVERGGNDLGNLQPIRPRPGHALR